MFLFPHPKSLHMKTKDPKCRNQPQIFGELKKFDKIITTLSFPLSEIKFRIIPFIKMPGVTIQPQIKPDLKMSSHTCQARYTIWDIKWWLHLVSKHPCSMKRESFFGFRLKITAWNLSVKPVYLFRIFQPNLPKTDTHIQASNVSEKSKFSPKIHANVHWNCFEFSGLNWDWNSMENGMQHFNCVRIYLIH